MNTIKELIEKRRTFAVIAHPDAGKTTLTEKLLLYGGAIREAGAVKSRRAKAYAVSDWMEIEKRRGISVTSSVMQFDYNGYHINILDTPGHQDFSEDTYRTLMAADSAVMVVDSAKGVEEQTKKLFKVASLRKIPIFTLANKMDRQAKSPFELMDDIESSLGIRSYPMNWPLGSGKDFKGVYNRITGELEMFEGGGHGAVKITTRKVDESELPAHIREELELLNEAGDEYDEEKILNGELTPIFFASALTNYGIETFLKYFLELSVPPLPRESNLGLIDPSGEDFSAFIFKIQANMNPAHRDRIAFMRICSGRFERGMNAFLTSEKKKIRLSQPQQFMAQDRVIVEEAFAGDIIGVQDPGIFKIGDTLSASNPNLSYSEIPVFAPEHFAKVRIKNSLKRKQFLKGVTELSEEGAIQVFRRPGMAMEELIIGVVGVLQFDILSFRLLNEYGVEPIIEPLSYRHIRWIEKGYDEKNFMITMDTLLVCDGDDRLCLLFQNEWSTRQITERNKGLELSEISLRNNNI